MSLWNGFVTMVLLEWLRCNGGPFSFSSMFTNKSTVFLDNGLYRKISFRRNANTALLVQTFFIIPGSSIPNISFNRSYFLNPIQDELFRGCSGMGSGKKVSLPKICQLYKDLTRKTAFLRGHLGSSSIIWDWHLVKTWNFTPVWQKG